MSDDATLTAAPAADAGQPAPQAVPAATPSPDSTAAPTVTPAATAHPAPVPQEPSELAVLQQRYKASSEEALRLFRENEELKKQPAQPTTRTYTPQELNTMKRDWLVVAAKEPDRAAEAAGQVVLIDDELRKHDFSQFESRTTATTATERLRADLAPIVAPFQADLQPGTPVFNDTVAILNQAITAGMPDNDMTRGAAVILALAKAGKLSMSQPAKASKEATANLNQALKSAAAAGSGAANTNAASTPDFKTMAPNTPEGRQAFTAYRKSLGVGT